MLDELVAAVSALPSGSAVGLSGFAGAGKSTLAHEVASVLAGVGVVTGDDFLDSAGCLVVTDDWAGLERDRLREQVLDPWRNGEPVRWERRHWDRGLQEWCELPPCDVLLVEGVGVLHPSLSWDLAVWLDVPAETAVAQGIRRDHELYEVDTEPAWREIWAPTDLLFLARFRPDLAADLVLRVEP